MGDGHTGWFQKRNASNHVDDVDDDKEDSPRRMPILLVPNVVVRVLQKYYS
jgi:hypothetical protein